jgi:hypothetical protein
MQLAHLQAQVAESNQQLQQTRAQGSASVQVGKQRGSVPGSVCIARLLGHRCVKRVSSVRACQRRPLPPSQEAREQVAQLQRELDDMRYGSKATSTTSELMRTVRSSAAQGRAAWRRSRRLRLVCAVLQGAVGSERARPRLTHSLPGALPKHDEHGAAADTHQRADRRPERCPGTARLVAGCLQGFVAHSILHNHVTIAAAPA